jgi:hypothetical protein
VIGRCDRIGLLEANLPNHFVIRLGIFLNTLLVLDLLFLFVHLFAGDMQSRGLLQFRDFDKVLS